VRPRFGLVCDLAFGLHCAYGRFRQPRQSQQVLKGQTGYGKGFLNDGVMMMVPRIRQKGLMMKVVLIGLRLMLN